jgi:hypothetical protein
MPLGIGRLGCGDRDTLRDLQQSGDSRDEDFLISRVGDYGTYWHRNWMHFGMVVCRKGMEFAVQKAARRRLRSSRARALQLGAKERVVRR